MLELFTSRSSPAKRCTIMLAESGLPYTARMQTRQKKAKAFLKANPQGRMPTLVDHNGADGKPVILTQSMAIIFYVAEKSGIGLPTTPRQRARCWQWLMIFATDLYPAFTSSYYMRGMKPEPQTIAGDYWETRMLGYVRELEEHLATNTYLAGDAYTAADMCAYPTIDLALADFKSMRGFKAIRRWHKLVGKRPAVRTGMAQSS
ncbi:MAG: glutathione S-transferase family protein [Alphaproteobacteria bacterium]